MRISPRTHITTPVLPIFSLLNPASSGTFLVLPEGSWDLLAAFSWGASLGFNVFGS